MYKIIDTHCDTAEKLYTENIGIDNEGLMLNLSAMESYGEYIQFFAACVTDKDKEPRKKAHEILSNMKQEMRKNQIGEYKNG